MIQNLREDCLKRLRKSAAKSFDWHAHKAHVAKAAGAYDLHREMVAHNFLVLQSPKTGAMKSWQGRYDAPHDATKPASIVFLESYCRASVFQNPSNAIPANVPPVSTREVVLMQSGSGKMKKTIRR